MLEISAPKFSVNVNLTPDSKEQSNILSKCKFWPPCQDWFGLMLQLPIVSCQIIILIFTTSIIQVFYMFSTSLFIQIIRCCIIRAPLKFKEFETEALDMFYQIALLVI